MKFFLNYNKELIVFDTEPIFVNKQKKGLLHVCIGFMNINNEFYPLLTLATNETMKAKEYFEEISEFEVFFNEDYKNIIQTIINHEAWLKEYSRKIKNNNVQTRLDNVIQDIKQIIKQF